MAIRGMKNMAKEEGDKLQTTPPLMALVLGKDKNGEHKARLFLRCVPRLWGPEEGVGRRHLVGTT